VGGGAGNTPVIIDEKADISEQHYIVKDI